MTWQDTLTGRQRFLVEMALKHNWKRGAELGVRDGRTFIPLLENCPDLNMIGVDCWRPFSQDAWDWDHVKNETMVRQAIQKFGSRAMIYKGLTWDISFMVPDKSLDFIFIDADHSTPSVRLDISLWSPKVRPGGWIIGHDIDWDSVKAAVDALCPGYQKEVDNIWLIQK